jgi:hypothetical protein
MIELMMERSVVKLHGEGAHEIRKGVKLFGGG